MITSVDIQNFRGFDHLQVTPLKRVNILSGKNDTGKTSVLEAVVLSAATNSDCLHKLPTLLRSNALGTDQAASDDFYNYWSRLFTDQSFSKQIKINLGLTEETPIGFEMGRKDQSSPVVGRRFHKNHSLQTLALSDSRVTFFQGEPDEIRMVVVSTRSSIPTTDAELYNQASLLKGGEKRMEALMRIVDPRIQRLRYSKPAGTQNALVYVDIGLEEALPAIQMGQGFNRILHIYSQALVSKAEVIIIDEIENGIHYSVLPLFWKGLFELAEKENVQIIATTHSWECIRAAHEISQKRKQDEFSYLRLDRRKDDSVVCTAVDANTLDTAKEHGWEMR